ncbi:iron chaperone [Phytohabitans sp. LJ34]|uniref:iron chaperone n=1 Tax=Phytohabitans sp. LJ34 TaxID=3452217 RepID=UPI003F88E813
MPAKKAAKSTGTYEGFSAEERDAMKEHAKELKARGSKADAEAAVLAKIAEMPDSDRVMAERIHAIVTESAPSLSPKTWYGMPAYANAAGKVICFFTPAAKFKARYASFGFNEDATLDEGTMWPTAWALTKLTAADEKRIAALVKKAAG